MRRAGLIAALMAVAVAPGAEGQGGGQPGTALVGATLIDVATGSRHPRATVVIRGNRIAVVDLSGTLPIPPGVNVVDARGKYLIPGLIDTHVHLEEQWVMQPADTLAQFGWILASGVTTVREASAFHRAPNFTALREAGEAGRILAPRIHLSNVAPPAGATSPRNADVAEDLRSVREGGVESVKITNQPPAVALRTIRAAVDAGLPVWGHTSYFTADGEIRNYTLAAVHAGISGVSHVHYIYLVRPERDRRAPRRGIEGCWMPTRWSRSQMSAGSPPSWPTAGFSPARRCTGSSIGGERRESDSSTRLHLVPK